MEISPRGSSPLTRGGLIYYATGFKDTYNNPGRRQGELRRRFVDANAPLMTRIRAAAPNVGALKQRDTLRLCTAGSVDDGKSTFVGRLLKGADVRRKGGGRHQK